MKLYHTNQGNSIQIGTYNFPSGVVSAVRDGEEIEINVSGEKLYKLSYSLFEDESGQNFGSVEESLDHIQSELAKQHYDKGGRDVIGDSTNSLSRLSSGVWEQVVFDGDSGLTHSVGVVSTYDTATGVFMPTGGHRGHNYITRADIEVMTLRRDTKIEYKWVVNDEQGQALFDIGTKRQTLSQSVRETESVSLNPIMIFDGTDIDANNNVIVQNGAKFYIKVDKPVLWRPLNLYIITSSSNANPIQ